MQRMKTFLIYLLLVLAVVLSTDIISKLILETNYKDVKKYEITTTSPEIKIKESKATKANGRVKGTIKNNTESSMKDVIIELVLKSKTNVKLGTVYEKIDELKPGEQKDFSINYRYSDVDNFIIGTTDHEEKPESIENDPTYQAAVKYYPIARLVAWCVTPAVYFLPLFLFTVKF